MRAVENPCSGILMNFVSFKISPLGLSSIQKAAPTGSFSEVAQRLPHGSSFLYLSGRLIRDAI